MAATLASAAHRATSPNALASRRAIDGSPRHRIYVGRAEIGAGWSKRSNEGRNYLSVKLDDPSFTVPIYANLIEDASESFTLIWSRSRRQNGD